MLTRTPLIDAQLLLSTPEIEQLRSAAASDPTQQRALDAAVQAREDLVLDHIVEGIDANVGVIEDALFDPKVGEAIQRLKFFADYLCSRFSIVEHPKSKRSIPPGTLLTMAARRRGPLVGAARAAVGLMPMQELMALAADMSVVREVRARRAAETEVV